MRSIAVTPTVIHLDRRSTIGLLLAGVAAGAVGLAALTYSPPWAAEGDRPLTPPAAAAERAAAVAPDPQPAFALSPNELAVGYAGQVAAERTAALAPAPEPAFALSPDELAVGYAGQVAAERTAALAPAPQPAFALSPDELAVGYAGQVAAERTAAAAADLP